MNNRLYSPRKGDKITITKEDQKIIEELEANIQISGYYDCMVVWSKDDHNISYEDIMQKMQMISMTATPKLDKDKYKFYDVHYKLLRRLYLEEDHSDGCVTMGYKRPFGNSNVQGDVRVFLIDLKLRDDEDQNEDYTMENEVLKEFSVFITDFYKGGYELLTPEFDALDAEFPSFIAREETKKRFKEIGMNDAFLHPYLEKWVPSLSALRDKKLEDLGIN
jgi:hypothetical protein